MGWSAVDIPWKEGLVKLNTDSLVKNMSFDVKCYILGKNDEFCSKLMHFEQNWCILSKTDTFWAKLMHLGACNLLREKEIPRWESYGEFVFPQVDYKPLRVMLAKNAINFINNRCAKIQLTLVESWGFKLSNKVLHIFVAIVALEILAKILKLSY